MKKLIYLLFFAICLPAFAQEKDHTLSYYLPQDITYDKNIPKPADIIGHEVGEWHITHDKLVLYMKALAKASDRIQIEDRGTTFEGRPLLLLTVTTPTNHDNLAQIKEQHIAATEGSNSSSIAEMPIVIYQGFSIHGNEASGSNASMVYAYYLAAAQGPEIEKQLENTIILLDPSFNPDGLQRFAYWANTNRSMNLVADNNEREYHEVWPGGRTNHYWFDMNRDWLPVQLPESKARIKSFHEWLPNILTDHHEMGTNATFFFQPGEPTRVNPLTPALNQKLTAEIGKFHAKALDKIGSLYYSEEDYDDYYYGKGSTFPDINGGIGILFEQASSRGHIQESDNGVLTFPFTIKNQFTTALSTLEAATNLREKLLSYQRKFYEDARAETAKSKTKAIIFGDKKDAAKAWHLAEILKRHNIKIHELKNTINLAGKEYTEGHSYVVPIQQKNTRLLKAMFEKRTRFTDSLFYDISAWTFPLAFNLDYTNVNSLSYAGAEIKELKALESSIGKETNYAYLFEWNEYYTPKALHRILEKGIRVKVSKKPFSIEGTSFGYGTILIPVQNQHIGKTELHAFLKEVATESNIDITSVSTGLAKGIDLGSRNFETLKKQKVAIIVGDGIRSYDAGEIWHLLDTRYAIQLTKLDVNYINKIDLSKYTDIILPSFYGDAINTEITEQLKEWTKDGGTLIGYRNVAKWFQKNELMNLAFKTDTLVAKNIAFEQKQNLTGAQVTGGAIFESQLDLSHPINFGYKNNKLPLFRNTNVYIEPNTYSYNNPIMYTNSPLMSGYISEENLALLKNSVPFQVQKLGKGKVMIFTDNTNFRAFWYGTNKLLMNAIFFGELM